MELTADVKADRADEVSTETILHSETLATGDNARSRIFKVKEVLGSGGTGVIYKAKTSRKYTLAEKDEVAIKSVKLSGLSQKEHNFLLREISVHRVVQRHPHICGFYNCFSDRKNMYLILEYLPGGDVLSSLRRTRYGFDECSALAIIAQVLDALSFLHGMGVAHRDIKPENIMLSERLDGKDTRNINTKLIDFGLASFRKISAVPSERLSRGNVGTIRYACPQIMKDEPYFPEEADIWSTGVTLYTLIARKNPYLGDSNEEVLDNVENDPELFEQPKWRRISMDTKNIIKSMLHKKGRSRPTASQAHKLCIDAMNKLKCVNKPFDEMSNEISLSVDGLRFPQGKKGDLEVFSDLAETTEEDETMLEENDAESIFNRIKDFFNKLTHFGVSNDLHDSAGIKETK